MRKKLSGLLAVLLLGSMLITGCGPQPTSKDGTQSESSGNVDTQNPSESESEKPKPWEKKKYEATGLTNLKEAIASKDGLGEDTIVGCVVNGSTIKNEKLMDIVHEHFNAVTFENENKPQFSFADNYAKKARTTSYELNGETVEMPILNFSHADNILNVLLEWNNAHPESYIKVRGHVLVWHGQTPEWFFHEDFDESKPYVTKDVMNVREEWYIKNVLEHFCGEDSKYKGMYYGWDVVNEACSDGNGYRKDTEGSSWWAVYQSEEFIVNAFKYANKYAPADVALYYNEYGDCSNGKVNNICALLKAVKAEEGEPGVGTRIDGMGMQAHYSISGPTALEMMVAGRRYGNIVDKIMLTEFDWNVNNSYDGTEESKQYMFEKQATQYKEWYDQLKDLEAKGIVDVAGITTWCVTDEFSWLQSANDAGGGADGTSEQFPALFDSNYQPKPSFWAFVDPSKM